MNAIIIIAHAPLASALQSAALHVFPEFEEYITAVDIENTENQNQAKDKINAKADFLKNKKDVRGILLISDLIGATPSNAADEFQKKINIPAKLITGANLPMIIRALNYKESELEELVEKAIIGGKKSIEEVKNA